MVDYFLLPNGSVDVFLRKNETTQADEEGGIQYVAEEVYFRVDATVTKEDIEQNFEHWWGVGSKKAVAEPTGEERLQALEQAMLELILGGAV